MHASITRRLAASTLLTVLAIALLVALHALSASVNCTAVLYGNPLCPHCRATLHALEKLGINVTFIDVTRREGQEAYVEMFERYMLRLTTLAGVPLTYVECGGHSMLILGELTASGVSVADEYKLWSRLLESLSRGTSVSALGGQLRFRSVVCLSAPGCNATLEKLREELVKRNMSSVAARLTCLSGLALCLASNETIKPVLPGAQRNTGIQATPRVNATRSSTSSMHGVPESLYGLVALLVGLALLDSINPCFLALYALTIAAVASLRGRLAALATGVSVALGVFTGYYLLGLGLVQAAASIPWARYIMAGAVIVLGALVTARRLGLIHAEGEKCLACKLAAALRVGSAEMTPLLGYIFGLVASLTLLPCSAGPYAIAALYLAGKPLLVKLLGLALYNLVFIAPIVAMAVAASFVAAYEAARRVIEPLAGPILVALGVYTLLEPRVSLLLATLGR